MKRTTLTNHVDAFRTEALMLLRFQFASNRISKFEDFQQITRSAFVDKLISLKTIENDLIIRICKFDDDTKGVHSFTKAITEIPTDQSNKAEIVSKIQEFRKMISIVKKKRRHTQLAHLKIGKEDNDYEIRYNLTPAINLIVQIIDLMNEDKISYQWNDGRYEKFNLRKEVLEEATE